MHNENPRNDYNMPQRPAWGGTDSHPMPQGPHEHRCESYDGPATLGAKVMDIERAKNM